MEAIENRERILNTALEAFLESGYRKVSMDEIAYRLGMSKKTIYTHVSSKRELLREALLGKVSRIGVGLGAIVDEGDEDVVARLHRLMLYLGEALPKPGRAFLEDMQRGLSDIWEEVDSRRMLLIQKNFRKLFEQAVEEQVITPKFEPEILVLVVSIVLQNLVRPEVVARIPYSVGQLASSLVDLLLMGLLTDEGRARYRRRLLSGAGGPDEGTGAR